MNTNLTDITVVLDRSSSMSICKEKAQSGLNDFIEKQKNAAGEALFTLVQFDNESEFVHKGVPIKSVEKEIVLNPSGRTALFDAVGAAIEATGKRLADMPEKSRPALVVFVILTDGEENASHRFKLEQIKEMIAHQQEKYSWKFIFLGANQDAFATGMSYGINIDGIANNSTDRYEAVYTATSDNLTRMRCCVATNVKAETIKCAFTNEELKTMV